MLRAVTFDFWNTLFVDARGREREGRRAALLRAALMKAGSTPTERAIAEALQATWEYFDHAWLEERRTPTCAELVDAALSALGVHLEPAERDRLVHRFERLVLELPPEPMPGAVSTLPELADSYRLAIICDTGFSPGSVLRELLEHHHLLAFFEYAYFSNEHGISKPDVRVFRHALSELGVRATEAAHVGDIQRTDIAGAQAAGMTAVHFVGVNTSDAARSTADLLVRHFDELPRALGSLIRAGC